MSQVGTPPASGASTPSPLPSPSPSPTPLLQEGGGSWDAVVTTIARHLVEDTLDADGGGDEEGVSALGRAATPFPQTAEEVEVLAREALFGGLALEAGATGTVPGAIRHFLQSVRVAAAAPLGLHRGVLAGIVHALHDLVSLSVCRNTSSLWFVLVFLGPPTLPPSHLHALLLPSPNDFVAPCVCTVYVEVGRG